MGLEKFGTIMERMIIRIELAGPFSGNRRGKRRQGPLGFSPYYGGRRHEVGPSNYSVLHS